MPHVATMGTSSCATISIGGFKNGDSKAANEAYKADKTVPNSDGLEINQFYNDVLYPTSQPLGRTRDLPFTKLMEDIKNSQLKTKLVMATLNLYQYQGDNKYWHKELLAHDFKLIAKTKNNIGTVNYVYMRNPSAVEIEDGEA